MIYIYNIYLINRLHRNPIFFFNQKKRKKLSTMLRISVNRSLFWSWGIWTNSWTRSKWSGEKIEWCHWSFPLGQSPTSWRSFFFFFLAFFFLKILPVLILMWMCDESKVMHDAKSMPISIKIPYNHRTALLFHIFSLHFVFPRQICVHIYNIYTPNHKLIWKALWNSFQNFSECFDLIDWSSEAALETSELFIT